MLLESWFYNDIIKTILFYRTLDHNKLFIDEDIKHFVTTLL